MNSDYILDVSETDFEYEVIAHSQNVPVVVDFWAEWCGPCRMLGPLLERLAEEAGGDFRLAKVDVDENPSLAMRYNVHGIPAVKAFRNGQVVAEFVGAQPEPVVREFLRNIAPSQTDLTLEKAKSLLARQDWEAAEAAFQDVLESQPENPAALLGLAKCLLMGGDASGGLKLLQGFPASQEYIAAEKLRPLARAIVETAENAIEGELFLEAAYRRALGLVLRGNIPAALDGLMEILRQDKHFRNEEARKVVLGLFELMGEENPETRQYRSELASILF